MQDTNNNAAERTRSCSSAKVAALMIELGEAIREEMDTVATTVRTDGHIIFNIYGSTVTIHLNDAAAPAGKGGEL